MVFENLRQKLQTIQGRFSQSLADRVPDDKVQVVPEEEPLGSAQSGPAFLEKVKVLITEGELVISENDVEKPLEELELALLESDVAFSVAEEICSSYNP